VLAGLGEQLPADKGFICFNSLYKKKPGYRFKLFGNPAICKRPVAFRPYLAAGLAFLIL